MRLYFSVLTTILALGGLLGGCIGLSPDAKDPMIRAEVAPPLPAQWTALSDAAVARRAPTELWKQREALAQRAAGEIPQPNAAEVALTVAELLEPQPEVLKRREEQKIRTDLFCTAMEWRFQAHRIAELNLMLEKWRGDDKFLQARLAAERRLAEERCNQAAIRLRRLTGCPPGTGNLEEMANMLPEIEWKVPVPDYSVVLNWSWSRRCELNIAGQNLRAVAGELDRIPTGAKFSGRNFLNLPRRLLVKRAAEPDFDWQYATLAGAAVGCLDEIRTAYDNYLDQTAKTVQAEAELRRSPSEFARLEFQAAEHKRRLRLAELWAASGADPALGPAFPAAPAALVAPNDAKPATPGQKLAAAWIAEAMIEKP